MGLDMILATDNDAIAHDFLGGYKRTGGKGWSSIALSTGRDWSSKENEPLVAYFINKRDLGAKTQVGGFTFTARNDEIEAQAQKDMDRFVTEESEELGAIAYWCKATHIHAWIDALYHEHTGEHLDGFIILEADVLHKLRDDCAEVLEVEKSCGREATLELMKEHFPLTGAAYEMFAAHGYTQKHFDDLEQTVIFLDYLFTLDGAENARYAYDPWF